MKRLKFTLRLPVALRDRLKERAHDNRRHLNEEICDVLSRHLEGQTGPRAHFRTADGKTFPLPVAGFDSTGAALVMNGGKYHRAASQPNFVGIYL